MQNIQIPQSYPHSPERYAADIQRAESYLARNGETVKLSASRIDLMRAYLRGETGIDAGTIYAGGTWAGTGASAGGGATAGAGV
jgi:hypothetical protein